MLPHTMAALRSRAPEQIEALAQALGTEADGIGPRIAELGGGARRLGELGADRAKLPEALDAILQRFELQFTPSPPDRDELERLLEAAW
jgi:alcohol dehydrogenase class IV